jgi:cryptochrome
MTSEKVTSIHWFRKGLRLHDNPALMAACKLGPTYPVFVMDPYFAKPDIIGVNRYSFFLESLRNLDCNLRSIGSRLFVLKGRPEEQIPLYAQKWNATYITFEQDTEPYARVRDKDITERLTQQGIKVESFTSHTLFSYDTYISSLSGKPAPNSNGAFVKM